MKRKQGNIGTKILSKLGGSKVLWAIRWDMQHVRELEESTGRRKIVGVSYYEYISTGKPTIELVKDVVLNGINAETDEKILSGFEWEGACVWLSSENQFNYKTAYDLAIQTNGANLPITFKLGTTEKPIYKTFDSVDELTTFYTSAVNHVSDCLNEGWRKKDSVNWTAYESILNKDENQMETDEVKDFIKKGGIKKFISLKNMKK